MTLRVYSARNELPTTYSASVSPFQPSYTSLSSLSSSVHNLLQPHHMTILPSQLRVAAKCLMVQRRHPFVHRRQRNFEHCQRGSSQTPQRQAAEDPESILAQLQASPLIRKIADKPEALKALNDFAVLLKESSELGNTVS